LQVCVFGHDRLVEGRHRLGHRVQHAFHGLVGLHLDQQALRVGRAAASLGTVELAAQVGVVDLIDARQPASFFERRHGLHNLLLHPPRDEVADTQVSPAFEGRQVRLGGAEQVHRQEPQAQRHLLAWKSVPLRKVWTSPSWTCQPTPRPAHVRTRLRRIKHLRA
jgi:hypothetical protein